MSEARIAIAIFAKTPGLSPLKTRLAASIGKQKAEHAYALFVHCCDETLLHISQQQPQVEIFWALAEHQGGADDLWQGKQHVWTGPGDLGQRLHRVYSQLIQDFDNVILLGSDCPQLTAETITEAISSLAPNNQAAANTCTIGPAEDGGFYLFAGNSAIPERLWTSVRYSQNDTLQQLQQQLTAAAIHSQLLTPEFDIDTLAELQRLHQQFTAEPSTIAHSFAQQRLAHWLQTLFNQPD